LCYPFDNSNSDNSAYLPIPVLSYSYLLAIRPDEERRNNWTKVSRDTLVLLAIMPGVFDYDDVLLNVFGVMAGYRAFVMFKRRAQPRLE